MSAKVSFRSRLGEILWVVVYRTGLLRLGAWLVRLGGGGGPRVLCYHRIAADPRPADLSARRFRAHLDHLSRRYSFLKAGDLVRRLRDGIPLPGDAIVITVDDGYRDFPEATEADLAEARATVFAITGSLPGRGRFPGDAASPELLDAADLERLAGRGVFVGSHTRTHPRLPDLAADDLSRELAGSREDLPVPADLVAYPWGLADGAVAAAARRAGYLGGFVTGGGPVRGDTDPYRIPRIHVPGGASVARVACEAAGLVSWLRGIR
jgi:peptidoglycan/xylan/chitin deacetylase (PgdA/CDA1 family)